MESKLKKIILSLVALVAAGIAPNLFVIAEAGYAELSTLAVEFLIPSILLLAVIAAVSWVVKERQLTRQIGIGITAGLIGTLGLEIIRETGFRLGGMPGELPELMGVLLLNRFADGPNLISNLAGWSYHFWNGASFGMMYSIIVGKGRVWIGTVFGIIIGITFMMSPVVVALGVGTFGVDFGWGFPVTVTLAHIAFGTILGWFVFLKNEKGTSIFSTLKGLL
ncbi:MAG: hypothetical protein KGJ59_02060 [Bacteroidota bacterium]|nr:hypothetical protein [Bacteroidota bacterium]